MSSPPGRAALPSTVIMVGWISFFNEVSAQLVAPLIPVLLVTVLAAGPVALGLIEGVADAVAALLRLWSGRLSDVMGRRRKIFILAGYAIANAARPLIGIAAHWSVVVLLRSADRIGKGVRGAPLDALISDVTPQGMRGRAYLLNRTLDYSGAIVGGLLAAAVLAWSPLSVDKVILLAAIPGAVAVLLIARFVPPDGLPDAAAMRPARQRLHWAGLPPLLRRYLLILALFSLARTSESFILLRGHELGMGAVEVVLLWTWMCVMQTVSAALGGPLVDRYRKSRLLRLSWLAYGLSFGFIGWTGGAGIWVAVAVYGLFTGAMEGVERALVSDLAHEEQKGTAFGWYHMIGGLAAIPNGLAFGLIWHYAGAQWAFTAAGLVSVVCALIWGWLSLARVQARR